MLSDALLRSIAGEGKIYDLGLTLFPGMPGSNFHPPYIFSLMIRHGDRVGSDGCGASNELMVLSGHTGTHLDAIGHVAEHGQVHGGADATELQRGGYGLTDLGIENVGPMIARGVLLDVPAHRGVDALPGGYAVSGDELAAVADRQGVEVGPGDVVLIRTGWLKNWGDPTAFRGDDTGEPGPDASAAEWLASRRILATGSDTIAYEARPKGQSALSAHAILIPRHGVYIMEMVNCDELARDKVYSFLFIALPLKLKGATGSPVRPIAIR
ncbi:MAG TPA: cyclase family protein [Chloroflexota bacterium]|nr:cyclase family protein [Chloroflexota bacterium]